MTCSQQRRCATRQGRQRLHQARPPQLQAARPLELPLLAPSLRQVPSVLPSKQLCQPRYQLQQPTRPSAPAPEAPPALQPALRQQQLAPLALEGRFPGALRCRHRRARCRGGAQRGQRRPAPGATPPPKGRPRSGPRRRRPTRRHCPRCPPRSAGLCRPRRLPRSGCKQHPPPLRHHLQGRLQGRRRCAAAWRCGWQRPPAAATAPRPQPGRRARQQHLQGWRGRRWP